MLRGSPQARRLLRRMGLENEDAYFLKQMGKGMLCTYALVGVAWLWNETSPLGWWTLKPRPKGVFSTAPAPNFSFESWGAVPNSQLFKKTIFSFSRGADSKIN